MSISNLQWIATMPFKHGLVRSSEKIVHNTDKNRNKTARDTATLPPDVLSNKVIQWGGRDSSPFIGLLIWWRNFPPFSGCACGHTMYVEGTTHARKKEPPPNQHACTTNQQEAWSSMPWWQPRQPAPASSGATSQKKQWMEEQQNLPAFSGGPQRA